MQVRQLHFGGGDQIHAIGGLEQVFLELRKLRGTSKRLRVRNSGNPPFLHAAARVRIGHEVDQRALQTSTLPAQHVETAARKLNAALEVHNAQLGAKIPVSLCLKVELTRRAPTTNLGIVIFVLANRRGGVRHVRRAHQDFLQARIGGSATRGCFGKLLVDLRHLRLDLLGFVLLALTHELADFLGKSIALGLQGLFFSDCGAALVIKLRETC